MPRLDVHKLPDGTLVVDVQADLLELLNTRVVVPLIEEGAAGRFAAKELNPSFVVDGISYRFMTQALAAVPRGELGPAIASLDARHDSIVRALDLLLIGY